MPLSHNLDTSVFRLISVTIADPTIGNQLSWPCPDRSRVQILSIAFEVLVANAGANRLCVVAGNDGTNDFAHSPLADLLTINGGRTCMFAIGADARDHEASHSWLSGELSSALFLDPGDSLVTLIDVINAGDQIQAIKVRYRQWIMNQ